MRQKNKPQVTFELKHDWHTLLGVPFCCKAETLHSKATQKIPPAARVDGIAFCQLVEVAVIVAFVLIVLVVVAVLILVLAVLVVLVVVLVVLIAVLVLVVILVLILVAVLVLVVLVVHIQFPLIF